MECTTERKPVFTLQVSEGEAANADERVDEVVIGVGPAFGKHQHKTLIDMPHNAILKELVAGIEEEGLHARVVRILRTSDVSFMAWDAANLSGSGIGIGIQSNHGDSSARSAAVKQPRAVLSGSAADAGNLSSDW